MPEDFLVPAGNYKVQKKFRNEDFKRKQKDMPWSKKILDLDRNQLFGRTAWGWTRIVSFYLLLYFFVILIVVLLITIFHFTIYNKNRPRWLKDQPGVTVVPGGTGTIRFQTNIQKEIYRIADQIDEKIGKIDETIEKVFQDCNKDKTWGYQAKEPCVFVKLNTLIGYKADTYDTIENLPSKHPDVLEETMRTNPGIGKIWITCDMTHGKTTQIKYIPGPYFDTTNNLKGASRVVALQLRQLPLGDTVDFDCTVWARNIDVDSSFQGAGHVKFSINMK